MSTFYIKHYFSKIKAPDEAQRKPRIRTPKVAKTDEGGNKAEPAKGRKRKRSLKVDGKETSNVSGDTGPATEVDSVTATIEAVLANVSAIGTSADKPKKVKRVKKQDQEGDLVKTKKQDAEATAEDVDENDDDSSTAGN